MKSAIYYRADNPERNKIYVWKKIYRKVRYTPISETPYILWRNYKWCIREYGQDKNGNIEYEIKFMY